MTTIKDVAQEAGVSVATISRYINDSGYVGERSRKKIADAINNLNYFPNAVARSLSTKSSPLIGLLVPDLENPYFPQLAQGVENELVRSGYSVLLGSVESEKHFLEYLNTFRQNNVIGVISSVGFLPKTIDIPIVEIDRISENSKYTITTNDFHGGQLVALRLLETSNMKNVTVITGPKNIKKSMERSLGIYSLLKGKVQIREIQTISFGLEGSSKIIEELFDTHVLPDTIIAPNDIYAILIVQELLRRNIKIPEEVQVVGYDGIDFLDIIYPKIATIKQPIFQLGVDSANLLLRIVENKETKKSNICLDVSFSEGETLRISSK